MFVVGLTGGIGSGKTSVSDFFNNLGITIVDADEISREITAINGSAIKVIEQAFGKQAISIDGAMNRAYIRELVFNNPSERLRLEEILHPLIQEISLERLMTSKSPYSILSVPLLTEKGFWIQKLNRLLVIDVPKELQIQRVMKRSGLAEKEVEKILAAQSLRYDRLKLADDIIENSSSVSNLRDSVLKLHTYY
ncbi:MAG: dephospho-CoA kinase, partial [Burkholderiales bacterium]|nr:dephospho-CoA kinase [Burkholderiales bacterium]